MRKDYRINAILIFIVTLIIIGAHSYSSLGHITIKSKFNNIVICVDPGHQIKGNSEKELVAPRSKIKKPKVTYGTTGVYTKVPEYKFNLKLSLKIEKLLKKDGFKVVMTRRTNNVNLSNIERAEIANKSNANLFLRIHADGSNDKNMHGISVLYPAKNAVSKKLYNASKSAAMVVLKSVISKTVAKSGGIVPRSDMTGFNWCKRPSILIEAGFMTNVVEDKKLENDAYENCIAEGIVNGIKTYFKGK